MDRATAIVGLPIAAAHRSEVIGATLAEVPTLRQQLLLMQPKLGRGCTYDDAAIVAATARGMLSVRLS